MAEVFAADLADRTPRGRQALATKLATALDILAKSPDDPAANLAAGSYYCFVSNRWDLGIPLLAKGSDPTFKEIAGTEMANPSAPDAWARLADRWWDAAGKQTEVTHDRICVHAAQLYSRAIENVSGLQRTLIERRIAEAAGLEKLRHSGGDKAGKTSDHWIDLTKFIDLKRDQMRGHWQINDGVVTADKTYAAGLQISYRPPEEYDLRFEFARLAGSDAIGVVLVKSNAQFAWNVGGFANTKTGFEFINGQNMKVNASGSNFGLTNGRRYNCLIKVRNEGLTVYIDEKLVTSYKTDYRDLTLSEYWSLRNKTAMGLRSYQSAKFHAVELLEVTGHGGPITDGDK